MDTATVKYLGDLRTAAVHLKSGTSLTTDAPIDNNGKGESFSPTDLTAVALASCMLTVMGIAARKHGIIFNSALVSVKKHMVESPRRIAKIAVEIQIKDEHFTVHQMKLLETAAINCPVAKSLHPEMIQEIAFIYTQTLPAQA